MFNTNINTLDQIGDLHPAYCEAPRHESTPWQFNKIEAGCYRLTTDNRWNIVVWKDASYTDPWHYVLITPLGDEYDYGSEPTLKEAKARAVFNLRHS